jgi:ADP-ribose pyrophosphatase YjhB (NUDIX family)
MQFAESSSYFSTLTPYAINVLEKPYKRMKRCGMICVKQMFKVPHVLVVRGATSHIWSLPKGCMNEGETEVECATRECFEETGLRLILDDSHHRININHNIYFVVPLEQHGKFKIHDKNEVDKVCWMTLNELKQVDCNKDLRSILQYPAKKFLFHTTLYDILGLQSLITSPMIPKKPYPHAYHFSCKQPCMQTYKQSYKEMYKQTFKPYQLFQTPSFRDLVTQINT